MRSIKDIENELEGYDRYNTYKGQSVLSPRQLSEARKRVAFLRFCKSYLELCNPTEEILKRDLITTEKELEILNDGFEGWKSSNPGLVSKIALRGEDTLKAYLKLSGSDNLKHKIKVYKFLLS